MKFRYSSWFRALGLAIVAAGALSSCSVSSDGPATDGASHGGLGSQNMSDYYYMKAPGWTYTFNNVENIYNADGTVAQTLTGAPDYVYTMGYDGLAPTGDSLFRYQITYRILAQYAYSPGVTVYYMPSTWSNRTHGAFVDGTDSGNVVPGMVAMQKRPKPVSTDTILAGIAGRLRTTTDDFSNSPNNTYMWQVDTLWTTEHLDSVYIWERQVPGGPLVKERCVFLKNFTTGSTWIYDVINNPHPTTFVTVVNPNMSYTVPAGSYNHVAEMRIVTSEVDDWDFNREYKYFACGTGLIYQYDWWYATRDGSNYNMEDFSRSLVSLTHN